MTKSEALDYILYKANRLADDYGDYESTVEHELLAAVRVIMDWDLGKLPFHLRTPQVNAELEEAYKILNSYPMFALSLTEDFITEAFEKGGPSEDAYAKSTDSTFALVGFAEAAGGIATAPMLIRAILSNPTPLIKKCVLRDPPKKGRIISFEEWAEECK